MQDVHLVVSIEAGERSVRLEETRYMDFDLLTLALCRVATSSVDFAQAVLDLPYANSRGPS